MEVLIVIILYEIRFPRSNLSGTFTFAFSYYLGLEGFTYGKIFGIIACFLGAVCVGLNDSEKADGASGATSGQSSAMGDSVAFFGAVCYGLYTTVLKYKVYYIYHSYCVYNIAKVNDTDCSSHHLDSRRQWNLDATAAGLRWVNKCHISGTSIHLPGKCYIYLPISLLVVHIHNFSKLFHAFPMCIGPTGHRAAQPSDRRCGGVHGPLWLLQ